MLRSCSVLVLCFVTGCSLFGRVAVEPVGTSFQRPSNVAAYVSVSDGDQPVTDLLPENFKVYENSQQLSSDETRQTLLTKELVATHQVLLLVDVSGKNDADSADALARAVASFVDTVRRAQPVSVFAFDGGASLHYIADFSKAPDGASADLKALAKFEVGDTSRNLNGAVVSGLKELDNRLSAAHKSIKVGTLVVFTRGPDLAGRVSSVDLAHAIDDTHDEVVALGIADQAGHALADIGKSAVVHAASADALGTAFEEAATKVRDLYGKYYLIAYCSPARSGTRYLKLEVSYRNVKGDEKHGSFSEEFSANGFGPGCNPQALPRFAPKPVAPKEDHSSSSGKATPGTSSDSKPSSPSDDTPVPPPNDDDGNVAPPPDKPGYSR